MKRTPALLLTAALAISVPGCSPPRWVHELPRENLQIKAEKDLLNGYWERPFVSPYSLSDTKSSSAGRESLEIKNQNYSKIHIYAEIVHGEKKVEMYREEGIVQVNGPWILLTPENSGYYRKEGRADASTPPHAVLPGPDDHKLVKKKKPEPLLYFLDLNQMTLTPLAMERMGTIYEWGIYEGSTSPHDFESSSFLDAVNIYNNKRYQKHGYIKRR